MNLVTGWWGLEIGGDDTSSLASMKTKTPACEAIGDRVTPDLISNRVTALSSAEEHRSVDFTKCTFHRNADRCAFLILTKFLQVQDPRTISRVLSFRSHPFCSIRIQIVNYDWSQRVIAHPFP